MKISIDENGRCSGFGNISQWPYTAPPFMNHENFNRFVCVDLSDTSNPESWNESPIEIIMTPIEMVSARKQFGEKMLLEFFTGTNNIKLDATQYQQLTSTFMFAELALRRGDVAQAYRQLDLIPVIPPIWSTEIKSGILAKIVAFLDSIGDPLT